MDVTYVKLDPETLEPSEVGIYYRKTTMDSGSIRYEAVNGHIDEQGEWVPDDIILPPQPQQPDLEEQIASLKAENNELKARLGDVEVIIADILTT